MPTTDVATRSRSRGQHLLQCPGGEHRVRIAGVRSREGGLLRFTTSPAELPATHDVRVNCVVPHWIGLDRAHAELAAMPAERRAAAPPLIPPEEVVSAVVDETMSGRVVVLEGGRKPPLLEST